MTEAEWNACTDPQAMLEFLRNKASDRKLRLFAVACCRKIWHALPDEHRPLVDLLEKRADEGRIEMQLDAAREAVRGRTSSDSTWSAARAAVRPPDWAAGSVMREILRSREHSAQELGPLLHDLFGNPFRPAVADPAWLAWNAGTVIKLAQAIYTDRSFNRMPILADALEDAGCTNQDMLGHCRGPGPHVLGCWAVDLLLGKE
jgi:hypothetical protein